MADKPILFSGPMVVALLADTKTQTRRTIKLPHNNRLGVWEPTTVGGTGIFFRDGTQAPIHVAIWHTRTGDCIATPHQVGDRLWVRETHAIVPRTAYRMSEGVQQTLRPDDDHDACVYAAGWERTKPGIWKPSIFMPRWASRITLNVTGVKVERLQDISEAEALAEGVPDNDNYAGSFEKAYCRKCGGSSVHGALGAGYGVIEVDCAECETAKMRYRNLWNFINGLDAWEANPWVAAYTFDVILKNIDEVA